MEPYLTSTLDQIILERSLQLEQERQILLEKTQQWLEEFASVYGINKVYIFGSVTRPKKFNQNSDIDLAVEEINAQDYFLVISLLSAYLGREVDLIKLENCHFAERIRQTGILWTKNP